mmetsp:Transcript_104193/g.179547  ORF Transcript_104193/g.179547 Transcript_104193/m.179547 type:complete len:206 (-) Transcript_104193:2692-3309(-)
MTHDCGRVPVTSSPCATYWMVDVGTGRSSRRMRTHFWICAMNSQHLLPFTSGQTTRAGGKAGKSSRPVNRPMTFTSRPSSWLRSVLGPQSCTSSSTSPSSLCRCSSSWRRSFSSSVSSIEASSTCSAVSPSELSCCMRPSMTICSACPLWSLLLSVIPYKRSISISSNVVGNRYSSTASLMNTVWTSFERRVTPLRTSLVSLLLR